VKLTQAKASKAKRVLIYGESLTGKTTLTGTLAAKYKMLWFDLEKGYESLLKLPTKSQENIELIAIPDTKIFPIAIETMLKVFTGKEVFICEEHGKVACPVCKKTQAAETRICLNELDENWVVVLDSLTQLSASTINHLMKDKEDTAKPEWEIYRAQGALLEKILSSMQQSKHHIVCISHVVESQQEDGKVKLFPVCGTSNFSRNCPRFFDDVVYLELKNKKHTATCSTTYANNITAGSRLGHTIGEDMNLLSLFIDLGDSPAPVAKPSAMPSQGAKAISALSNLRK
jgi:adenylate kinase family enzyme